MLCHHRRDDKRVDLAEFKKALPLLVRLGQVEIGYFDCTLTVSKCTNATTGAFDLDAVQQCCALQIDCMGIIRKGLCHLLRGNAALSNVDTSGALHPSSSQAFVSYLFEIPMLVRVRIILVHKKTNIARMVQVMGKNTNAML